MRFFRKIIFYCEKKIQTNEKGLVLGFLYFLSLFWQVASWCKNFLYDKKILRPKKILSDSGNLSKGLNKSKIISIGNITAGGTGKTPFVLELIQEFFDLAKTTDRTKKVDLTEKTEKNSPKTAIAILSRGYQSEVEHQKISYLVKPDQTISWKKIGDEPAMIANRLFSFIQEKTVFLFVGKHREISADMAAKIPCGVILLDDGFSYRKLARDEDIVLINGKDPLGKNFFLPRGFLRESPKTLKRASLVVIHQVFTQEEFNNVKEQLQRFTKAPFVGMRPVVKRVVFQDKKEIKLKKAALFSAIGSPKLFYEQMKKSIEIVDVWTQLDHEPFLPKELQNFAIKAKNLGAEALLCTEKDFVKLSFETPYALPIGYVEMGLDIFVGKEHINDLVQRIKNSL